MDKPLPLFRIFRIFSEIPTKSFSLPENLQRSPSLIPFQELARPPYKHNFKYTPAPFRSNTNIFRNYNQVLPLSKIITKKPLNLRLTPNHSFDSLFHAPKILCLPPKLYHAIFNIILALPLRNLPKIFFLPSFLKLFLIRSQ